MKRLLSLLLAPLLAAALWLSLPTPAQALVHAHNDENGIPVVRSLESLRDLDYQSWQVVAYREGPPGGTLKLRIPQTFVPSIMFAPKAAYKAKRHRVHHSAKNATYTEIRADGGE